MATRLLPPSFVPAKPAVGDASLIHMDEQAQKTERTDTRMSVRFENSFDSVNAYRALNRMTSSRIHQIGLSHHQNISYLRFEFTPRSTIQRFPGH